MRRAFEYAAAIFSLDAAGGEETWGWGGKTLSGPASGHLWLRVAETRAEKAASASWKGPEEAHEAMPDRIPRPRFRGAFEWSADAYAYRAEVHNRAEGRPLNRSPLAPSRLDLSPTWWAQLRDALDTISLVSTSRVAVRQERLRWALPRFLGTDVATEVLEWGTAHADIQWSNLTGPELCILDWERWGLAPAGYDAATLYISSLAVSSVADRVLREFKPILQSASGRFSQLVVASEYLQGIERGNNLELEAPLRKHLAHLLG